MPQLTLPAPAKLNLFLHVTGQREDGYHTLQTLFQLLDFGDELSVSTRDDGELSLKCVGPQSLKDLPPDDNLVLRAARLLRERSDGTTGQALGADIILNKRLPAGGGLGGGSSDAASTLLALNHLWALNRSTPELATLGAELGADVPVFLRGHCAWGEGTGDRLTPMELPARWYLVLHPGCAVCTAEVFRHPELTRNSLPITIAAFFAGDTRNDCENLVRRLAEPVDKALIWLQKFGKAALTGTGACVFASFDNEAVARAVLSEVPEQWQAFVARGVNRSPALDRLL